MPRWLGEWMYPIDKVNLDVLRFAHFLALAAVTVHFIPADWPALKSRWARPAILCGQHSLEIFCLGVFLAFAAHFVMVQFYGGILAQIVLSIAGIAIMIGVAALLSWYKTVESRGGTPEAGSRRRSCRRFGMTRLVAFVFVLVFALRSRAQQPADCPVPNYLLYGDSALDRVNKAVARKRP